MPLPEVVTLRWKNEYIIWWLFTRARANTGWRDLDVILLAKVVRREADVRDHQSTLDRSSVLVQNKSRTLVRNNLFAVVDN